ncbi:MAG: hypothetical protein ACOCXP_03870 [Candidatus Dojkabacteria bacterium]
MVSELVQVMVMEYIGENLQERLTYKKYSELMAKINSEQGDETLMKILSTYIDNFEEDILSFARAFKVRFIVRHYELTLQNLKKDLEVMAGSHKAADIEKEIEIYEEIIESVRGENFKKMVTLLSKIGHKDEF